MATQAARDRFEVRLSRTSSEALMNWPGVGNGPAKGGLGEEQGPKGNGRTFESCRVRQKSLCRACRDCGGRISSKDGTDDRSLVRRVAPANK
jgi:hypothetical protein